MSLSDVNGPPMSHRGQRVQVLRHRSAPRVVRDNTRLSASVSATCYLTRHTGPLADRSEGAWLPGEEDGPEPLLLWHLTSPDGTQLAKAHIGSPISRAAAGALLDGVLDRVRAVNRDPRSTHVIESVTLYGSLADPDRQVVTDVDLIAFSLSP